MPALNFPKLFAPLVEQRIKRQTIRAKRKIPIKAGQTLYFYTGMRTGSCRKLGEAPCLHARYIRIGEPADDPDHPDHSSTMDRLPGLWIDGTMIRCGKDQFAQADGFHDWRALAKWFSDTHGLPFMGDLILW